MKPALLSTIGMSVLLLFGSPTVSAQEKTELSDPEVAAVAVTANQIDIKYAELAKQKSKNQDVLKFAETMINDHQSVIKQASALVTKLGVTPKENAVSRKLQADADKTIADLRKKSGSQFDKAYIDNEVGYHKAVIGAVKDLLIPTSENSELKQLLQDILPALNTHLEHANMLQNKLSN